MMSFLVSVVVNIELLTSQRDVEKKAEIDGSQ